MDFSKFEALESRVSAMLGKVSELTRQKGELEASLDAKAKELEAAEALIGELQAEREEILGRVDALLGRLE